MSIQLTEQEREFALDLVKCYERKNTYWRQYIKETQEEYDFTDEELPYRICYYDERMERMQKRQQLIDILQKVFNTLQ